MLARIGLLGLLAISACGGRDFAFVDQYRAAVLARQRPAEITDTYVTTMRERRQVVDDARFLIDLEFYSYVASLHEEQATWETIVDVAVISASTAATVVGGEQAKTILAAVVTAISGARLAVGKNYFADANRYALITRMRASRAQVLARIEAGMRRPVREYPVSAAIVDLVAYVHAGTLINAVQAIAEQSTRALETEQGNLESIRSKPVPEESDQ